MNVENDALNAVLDHFYWWNRKDAERSGAPYHEDVVYDLRGPNGGFQAKGKDVVMKATAPWFDAMPENRVTYKNLLCMGNQVVMELESPEVDPATGEPILIQEVCFWEMKDGKIHRLMAYRLDPNLFSDGFREMLEAIIKGS